MAKTTKTRTAPEHLWAAFAMRDAGTLSAEDCQRVSRAYINSECLPALPPETRDALFSAARVEKAKQDAKDARTPCPACGAVRPLSERRGLHCAPCWAAFVMDDA